MLTVIFRCRKKSEMYLYLPFDPQRSEEQMINALPESLLKMTGVLEQVMQLELTPEKKLARASASEVLSALHERGYYLQMPPAEIFQSETPLFDPADGF